MLGSYGRVMADHRERERQALREEIAASEREWAAWHAGMAQMSALASRWGWCLHGHHADCRVEMPDGCGGWDVCGCPCHLGDAFDREMDSRIARERERDA